MIKNTTLHNNCVIRINTILFFVLMQTFTINCIAQKLIHQNDTTINKYCGKQTYHYLVKNNITYRNGGFTFYAKPLTELINNQLIINELHIIGTYQNGLPVADWKISGESYLVEGLKVQKNNKTILNSSVSGNENNVFVNFKNGKLNGKLEVKTKHIQSGNTGREQTTGLFNFDADTLKGKFFLTTDNIMIEGKTDAAGYLDGILKIDYVKDSVLISELRAYQHGFLTRLSKLNKKNNDTIHSILFNEVTQKLTDLKKNETKLNFKISNDWSGIYFNLGYQSHNPKISAQEHANQLIDETFKLFDSIYSFIPSSKMNTAILKLTRSFEFSYLEDKNYDLIELKNQVKKTYQEVTTIIDKPILQLRKNNSDSLLQEFKTIQIIQEKLDTLYTVLRRIEEGYFKHLNRYRYYSQGVPGLSEPVTANYMYKNEKKVLQFNLDNAITTPDSLPLQLAACYNELKAKFSLSALKINQSLSLFEDQEKIMQLDNTIAELDLLLPEFYPDIDKFLVEDQNNTPFEYKLYHSIFTRLINPLKTKYLNNGLTLEETISIGNTVVCYQQFLADNKDQLDDIKDLKKHWNDSLFTHYQDNPFDYRMLEVKILDGTQNAANHLLKYYANQMLNAKNCEQLNQNLQKIVKLDERVKYLTSKLDNKNVVQLDKILRKERVPIRIERILEL